MNWPWSQNKDFGDFFEEGLEKITKIQADLVFYGTESQAVKEGWIQNEGLNRPIMIIKRSITSAEDFHIFIFQGSAQDPNFILWYQKNNKESKAELVRKVFNLHSSNEITRILSKHWDFNKLL
jgi:hypothetical protein